MKRLTSILAMLLAVMLCLPTFGVNVGAADIFTTTELRRYTNVNVSSLGKVLSMTPDNSSLVIWGNSDKKIYIANIKNNARKEVAIHCSYRGYNDNHGNYGVSDNGRFIAITGDRLIDVIDVSIGEVIATFNGNPDTFAFKSDDKTLITSEGGNLTFYDIANEEIIEKYSEKYSINLQNPVTAINLIKGEVALSIGELVEVRDINTWDLITSFKTLNSFAATLYYSRDGKYLYNLSSHSGRGYVFDAANSYELKATIPINSNDEIRTNTYGSKVLVNERLFDIESKHPDRYIYAQGAWRFSPDYKYIYSSNGTVYYADNLLNSSPDQTDNANNANNANNDTTTQPKDNTNNNDNTTIPKNDTSNNTTTPKDNPNTFISSDTGKTHRKDFVLSGSVTSNGVKLQWNDISDSLNKYSYVVYRYIKGNQSGIPVFDYPIRGTEYTDVNALPNTEYEYMVAAMDDSENEIYSGNSLQLKTPEAAKSTTGNTSQSTTNSTTNSTPKNSIALQINNPMISVNGKGEYIDESHTVPILYNGRTLLPIRAVIESFGGTVEWDGETRIVTISLDGTMINMTINSKTIYVNGKPSQIDVAPIIINSRTMLPIRFVAENLGMDVHWDGDTQTATIRK